MEMIDVLTAQGAATGRQKPKSEVHRDGDWHLAVHVWLLNEAGELLLQHRSPQKTNDPGLWDVSVAGHVSAGEQASEAACREVAEEIGLNIAAGELLPLFLLQEARSLNQGRYLDHEFHQVYLLRRSPTLADLRLQEEEVSALRWVSQPNFRTWVQEQPNDLVPHWEEYQRLLAWLTQEK